jgi:hypothetical protein
MSDDASSFLGLSPAAPPPTDPRADAPIPADIVSHLLRRYSDAYTEAHATVTIGKAFKGVGIVLFIAILVAGLAMASQGSNRYGQSEMNGVVAGIGFALACLVGIPTYILGILVAAQGQTQLATLDTAVNSSRHLKDEDVAKILSRRFGP